MMFQRGLPAGGKKSGVSADDRGLRAGRKRRRRERCGQQLNEFPNARDRYRRRVKMVCLNLDARRTGTVDGRHVASPILCPQPKPKRDTKTEPNKGVTVAAGDRPRNRPRDLNQLLSLRHSRPAAVTILPLGARVCAKVKPQDGLGRHCGEHFLSAEARLRAKWMRRSNPQPLSRGMDCFAWSLSSGSVSARPVGSQ